MKAENKGNTPNTIFIDESDPVPPIPGIMPNYLVSELINRGRPVIRGLIDRVVKRPTAEVIDLESYRQQRRKP